MTGTVSTIEVDTPEGQGRFHCDTADRTQAVLILGHGAGGALDAVDLSALASRLPARGITVARFEQPWRVAGKKVAGPPGKLDHAWCAAVPQLLADDAIPTSGDVSIFFGGRSAGARVACRTAPAFDPVSGSVAQKPAAGVAGVVCCAFPLHPPGRPDRSRAAELLQAAAPRLVLQGQRDTFGHPEEIRAAIAGAEAGGVATGGDATGGDATGGDATGEDAIGGDATGDELIRLVPVPDADHSMRTRKSAATTPAQVQDLITEAVADFCLSP